MRYQHILIGGTYRVRFKRGIEAKAVILQDLGAYSITMRGKNLRPKYVYRAELAERVGRFPKGHSFEVSSYSVLSMVSPPHANGHVESPETSTEPTATLPATRLSPRPTTATPAASKEVPKVTQQVSMSILLTLPLVDMATVLGLLAEYSPEVSFVKVVP
jgi:hypothetical protein